MKQNTNQTNMAMREKEMRCGGCGAKVGADVLSRALKDLNVIQHPDVRLGLNAPDDAAMVQIPSGYHLVQTVDFFRAFIDDPYRFGRIAANHALGDVFAMGAKPHTATAIVTLPVMPEPQTEDALRQMMTGAVEVLNTAGCALVGGHTGEGTETALGFAVNGLLPITEGALRKGGMQTGDTLILCKPIGTGVLMASLPQALSIKGFKGQWIENALDVMQQSNKQAAQILIAHGASACTDVTGFGLLGHLVEMTTASGVKATLDLDALPLLDGALHCSGSGIASTLAPANQKFKTNTSVTLTGDLQKQPLIFDPQTAGGLLGSVPAAKADACLQALREAGYGQAVWIGSVKPR